jgi:hypothetical protein
VISIDTDHAKERPMNHLLNTSQFAADRRAALITAGADERRARPSRIAAEIPTPGSPAFEQWAMSFGHRVAEIGLGRDERAAGRLARLAGDAAPVAAAVLADRSQPVVARERALGRVLAVLATPSAAGTGGRSDVAA